MPRGADTATLPSARCLSRPLRRAFGYYEPSVAIEDDHRNDGRLRRRSRDYVLTEMRSGLGVPSVPLIPLTGGTSSPSEIGRQKTTLSVCGPGAAFQPMIRCRRLQAVGTGLQAIRLSPYPSCTDGPPLHRFRGLPPSPTRLWSPVPFRDYSLSPGRGEVGVHRTSQQCELPTGSTPSRRLRGARWVGGVTPDRGRDAPPPPSEPDVMVSHHPALCFSSLLTASLSCQGAVRCGARRGRGRRGRTSCVCVPFRCVPTGATS